MVIVTQQGGNSMIMVFIKGGDGSKLVFCRASLLHLTMVKVLWKIINNKKAFAQGFLFLQFREFSSHKNVGYNMPSISFDV